MFDDLIIFEMANNHQGSIKHAKNIISTYSKISKKFSLNASIKLQYRDIPNFISNKELRIKKNKHVDRFLKTNLKRDEFKIISKNIKKSDLKLIITPFDEISVENAIDDDVDILKIASCSATDWPLIEKIASYNKPIIFSTGGQPIEDIDNLYSFLTHKNKIFSMMHCISVYPTDLENAQLNQIKRLSERYPNIKIGYSGHEKPEDYITSLVAVGVGANLFERHVGIPTKKIQLNKYSMNPKQTESWITNLLNAKKTLKNQNNKIITNTETDSIKNLQRGVFLKKSIKKGQMIKYDDIYFAFPLEKNQMPSGSFIPNIKSNKKYAKDQPLMYLNVIRKSKKIREHIHHYKGMLNEANITVGNFESMELSHHYGINKFNKFGIFMITFFNNFYCKKIICLLAGQRNPLHRHFKKTESFHILYGELLLILNDIKYTLKKGDTITIDKGMWHEFKSENGCIFEEISTKHVIGDSEYKDRKINSLDTYERKTKIEIW